MILSHITITNHQAILYALGANFGIAVAKGAAAAYTGSGAMLAECIHSFADCANQDSLEAELPADYEALKAHMIALLKGE